MALAECGTHGMFAANVGTYADSEATFTGPLLVRLGPGMLLTADRGFSSPTPCGARRLVPAGTNVASPYRSGRTEADPPARPA